MAISILIFRTNQSGRISRKEIIIQTDTLRIRDTVLIAKPATKTIRTIDTIYIPKKQIDTIIRTDTVFIKLPKEQHYYEDSRYSAWISGYRPQLDSIRIYPEHQIITNTLSPYKSKSTILGIGIQIGYGATLNGNQVITSPYIGIGVSWNLIQF